MSLPVPSYDLSDSGKLGQIKEEFTFYTPITGYDVEYMEDEFFCQLYPSGKLTIFKYSIWDFGTYAIDTPDMIVASLFHDAMCKMTNHRVLPWKVRKKSDAHFRWILKQYGGSWWRWTRWLGVSFNSQLISRWRDKK